MDNTKSIPADVMHLQDLKRIALTAAETKHEFDRAVDAAVREATFKAENEVRDRAREERDRVWKAKQDAFTACLKQREKVAALGFHEDGTPHQYKPGTRLHEWEYKSSGYRWKAPRKWTKTGKVGVVEVLTSFDALSERDERHHMGSALSGFGGFALGDLVLRPVKKNGELGKVIIKIRPDTQIVTTRWQDSERWLPEDESPTQEETNNE